jgi:hypothetical protein
VPSLLPPTGCGKDSLDVVEADASGAVSAVVCETCDWQDGSVDGMAPEELLGEVCMGSLADMRLERPTATPARPSAAVGVALPLAHGLKPNSNQGSPNDSLYEENLLDTCGSKW